ncbi:Zinc finger protein zpr1 [Neolecta irregularis DAH-3]|uniref:Zinc finger protein zpr1 n=1 Tax=Neolecta irregularis (strain DAH-3) TaxID=1198029 RepID=A0A1U7LWX8_NEOID|nr:Zinc finger protein zpr1 [Neolecta irregularis DAH-3]|eukprot:OLL27073.1 Zinc finger protein zpr1 [Neolecta irregularis DAH-3]
MSFECPHCGLKNSEIKNAGIIQEKGARFIFNTSSKTDLNRQIVKSETCTSTIPELDLEIPPQRGQLTTVEGLLATALEDLEAGQTLRKHQDPKNYEQIEEFLCRGRKLIQDGRYTIILDDPSGNSWIEYMPGESSKGLTRSDYIRSSEQNKALGLTTDEIMPEEVHTFNAKCPSCEHHCDTRMKMVDIPHFKEVVLMSTTCDSCGYRSNEVKTGGAIPDKARKIILKVEDAEDLNRDILKAGFRLVEIPELGLDLHPGTLGGRFTTLEGLLKQVHSELYGRVYSQESDSTDPEKKARWESFLAGLSEAEEGKRKFTVILDDPLAASHLQNPYAPDKDPNMEIEDYERTPEQEDDLGIKDLKRLEKEEQAARQERE